MFLTHPHGGWCDRLGAGIRRDRAPSSRLRSTYLSNKCCSYDKRAVGDCKRKRSQPARNRPEHDLRALPGIEFRVVTRAFENVLVAFFCLHPLRDGTSGVRANHRMAMMPSAEHDRVSSSISPGFSFMTRISFSREPLRITFLRSLITAGLIFPRRSRPTSRQGRLNGEERASRLLRTLHLCFSSSTTTLDFSHVQLQR